MTTRHDDGGPAFPVEDRRHAAIAGPDHPGMTLLDCFAAHALTGLLAANPYPAPRDSAVAAEEAYSYASAMIAERKKMGGR